MICSMTVARGSGKQSPRVWRACETGAKPVNLQARLDLATHLKPEIYPRLRKRRVLLAEKAAFSGREARCGAAGVQDSRTQPRGWAVSKGALGEVLSSSSVNEAEGGSGLLASEVW